MQNLNIVILAAGLGRRLNSDLPKVLHKVAGKPMLQHVLETAISLNPERIVIVYGHAGEQVKSTIDNLFPGNVFIWALQQQQLGTGDALRCAYSHLNPNGATLLLCGDVPLITASTLQSMIAQYANNVVLVTTNMVDPNGYGRIIRNANAKITAIIEDKDATAVEKQITEINTGIYLFTNQYLADWLVKLSPKNQQAEYYVTDIIGFAKDAGIAIESINTVVDEVIGVNDKVQLEYVERLAQMRLAQSLLVQGVTLIDKSRLDIRGTLVVGRDCSIDINCIFEGVVTLGNNVTIGAGVFLKDAHISDGVKVLPYSIIEGANVEPHCQIGPFARVRPGTSIAPGARVGNFVEVKNSTIGSHSKINHLTYIGDTDMGANVNVGAGSVTCNYDGQNKFRTTIGDGVFVGSGTMLVAPVKLGIGSVIGAGSTITRDTDAEELTVARTPQRTITGWIKKTRKNKV